MDFFDLYLIWSSEQLAAPSDRGKLPKQITHSSKPQSLCFMVVEENIKRQAYSSAVYMTLETVTGPMSHQSCTIAAFMKNMAPVSVRLEHRYSFQRRRRIMAHGGVLVNII